ncbi:hypothetical protein PhaeoP72_01166 [Phaeobacter inhibens]|uniref:hypothetical protein n=1 Tax=Phaeobacter inhibens TaxID=221822 RepID=UPI000C9CE166|nr:hypothetical protein [Phaeobacter inhibens]AUR03151.1 hypothetical protein PhaeoP72_01166 [Phaeobacter inhibens]
MSEAPKVIWLTREELPEFEDTHQCEGACQYHHDDTVTALQEEVERLEIENWHLKKALDLFDKMHRAALAKEDT